MKFGNWTVGSLYRSWSLRQWLREFVKLIGFVASTVRWDKGTLHKQRNVIFFFSYKRKWKSSVRDRIFCASAFVGREMSYMVCQ